MPTAQEAFSILHHGTSNPAINTVVFPDTDAEYWWTVEQQVGNTSKVWVTNAGGGIGNHPKSETISAGGTKRFHVRAVRDMAAPALLSNQFTWQDSTVIDQLTGLEWQRFVFADSMTWEQALGYAENLVVNGKTDWRLPNIKELESLNDESISQPSINPAVFQGIGANRYWSSTSLPNQATRAWYMDARFGVITYNLKTARNNILCVRGGNEILTEVVDRNRQAHQVQVFPNPFYSYIIVKTEQLLPVVQLMDINGLVLFSGQNIENEDFSYLPSGVYFLRFLQPNTLVIRIIKK